MQAARRFKSARSILALILREMGTTYGRSPGGFIWTILVPVLGIAFLSLVFSLTFRTPALGSNFQLFYASGMLPFLIYRDISTKVAASLKFSRQLLFYPAITFIDAIFARFILNFLVHIIVFVIIITGINLIYDTNTILNFPPIILSLTLAAVLGLGIGCLNCFLFSVFPLWERLWAVLNRPLFILSAVLFLFERIPEPYRSYLWYNPIIHIVGIMRSGFYPAYDSSYTSAPYVVLISLIALNLGILFLNRFNRYILNY